MSTHKYARIERERRFLVKHLPDELAEGGDYTRIVDLYIEGARLRLRHWEPSQGGAIQYKLGQKYLDVDDDFENTVMTNIYLNENEYQLLAKLPGTRLVKRRYSYMFNKQRFSIDVFEEHLEGLALCEIELPEDGDVDIDLPPFVGKEVTQDARFTGGELVQMSSEDFHKLLGSL